MIVVDGERGTQHCETTALGVLLRHEGLDLFGLWTDVATLIAEAGESGEPAYLAEAGAVLREVSRIEHEAMQVLRCLEPSR